MSFESSGNFKIKEEIAKNGIATYPDISFYSMQKSMDG